MVMHYRCAGVSVYPRYRYSSGGGLARCVDVNLDITESGSGTQPTSGKGTAGAMAHTMRMMRNRQDSLLSESMVS